MKANEMTSRSVLCPVDFSAASDTAVECAVEEAKRREAYLDLLHVWHPGLEYAGEVPPIPFAQEVPAAEIEADLAKINVDLPRDRVRFHVRAGNPARDIVSVAKDLDSELVVMGTHARRGLARWIVGSVCEPVLHHSPCPVLVCRGPERED